MIDPDIALLLLRATVGVIFVMHGWNHGFGPGGLDGTARWFAGLGLEPARFHAAISSYLEIAVGLALLAGLLVPAAVAAGVGIMTTAFVTVHRPNGFFITKEGFEYVLLIAIALTVLAILGPGEWSLDDVLFDGRLDGLAWGLGAAALGIVSSAGMLAACWRPSRSS